MIWILSIVLSTIAIAMSLRMLLARCEVYDSCKHMQWQQGRRWCAIRGWQSPNCYGCAYFEREEDE